MIEDHDSIIVGLKNGDKAVFEIVYREYYSQLCFYCVKYVENFEDAEGIVQDLFVKLWELHDDLEINSSLNAYLYRAVQNYSLNFLRKQKTKDKYIVTNSSLHPVLQDSGLVKMEEDELRVILKHAILKLPEKRREIFELSRFDGFKYSK
ncbi:MAG: sigma-70 family RNA polymerase sigma factor, partial [Bacteroidota bacterium]